MIVEEQIFPVTIFKTNIDVTPDVIDYVYELKQNTNSVTKSNRGGWQSDMYTYVMDPVVAPIYNNVYDFIIEVYKTKFELMPNINAHWFNINQPYSYNLPHRHVNQDYSCIVYLKTPEDSGNLVFWNPIPETGLQIRTVNEYTFGRFEYVPKVGDVYMFPASLSHSVDQNMSKEDRISMAFDIG